MRFYNGTETFNLGTGKGYFMRVCPFTRKINKMILPVTKKQFISWVNGELAQDAFPHLTPDQREFIMTGITAEEWDKTFKKEHRS